MFTNHHSQSKKRGQNFSEYGVIAGVILVIVIGVMSLFGPVIALQFEAINSQIAVVVGGNNPTETPTLPLGDQPNPVSQPTDSPTPISADASITSGPLYSGNYSLATYSFAVSAAGSGSLSYAWTGPDSFNSPDQDPTYTFSCTELPGTVSVTVTDAIEQSVGVSVSLTACPSVASIVIDPGTASIVAGSTQTYTATGFDAYSNSLGDVTGDTTFTISGSGICSANVCGSTVAGSYTVTATDAGLTNTATLNVTAGPLASIAISPQTASVVAGSTQTQIYTAAGFDANGNSLGDVTGYTVFGIYDNDEGNSSQPSSPCSAGVCDNLVLAGSFPVTATYAGLTASATLNVTPGPLAFISISPRTASVVAGSTQTYTTFGFDGFGNYVGDVTGDTTFTINGSGTCSANVCGSTVAGSHTVTATDAGLTDLYTGLPSSATLTVTAGPLASIFISPNTASIGAGSTQTYVALGLDAYGNRRLGNVTGDTTFTIGGSGTCSANVCGSTVAGSYTVTATDAGLAASATLNVTAGLATSIVISPQTASIVAGSTQTYTVTGFDAYGNSGDVTSSTTFSGPGSTCFANVCRSTVAGSHTITGATPGPILTNTATLTVSAAAASKLSFTQSPGNTTAGVAFASQPQVTVQDQYGNTVTTNMSHVTIAVTGGAATVISYANPKAVLAGFATFSSCTITKAGTYTLTATDGSLTPAVSNSFTISAAAASKLSFTQSPGNTTAGVAFASQPKVTVQDQFGNTVTTNMSNVTIAVTGGAATVISYANPKAATSGVATFSGCMITKPGTYTLTATDGSLQPAVSGSFTISA
jgi:Flp pilus assembly pilin Flp